MTNSANIGVNVDLQRLLLHLQNSGIMLIHLKYLRVTKLFLRYIVGDYALMLLLLFTQITRRFVTSHMVIARSLSSSSV